MRLILKNIILFSIQPKAGRSDIVRLRVAYEKPPERFAPCPELTLSLKPAPNLPFCKGPLYVVLGCQLRRCPMSSPNNTCHSTCHLGTVGKSQTQAFQFADVEVNVPPLPTS